MFTQYQVPALLEQGLPGFSLHPCLGQVTLNIYNDIQIFAEYTKHAVARRNYGLARKCFWIADRLYINGDRVVKNAIDNIFVFSLSSLIPIDREERIKLNSIIPKRLQYLYRQQVASTGC